MFFSPPCGLYVCTHCKELMSFLFKCIFKAIGRKTKEYENHGLNGPLYVFREEPPIITKEIPL